MREPAKTLTRRPPRTPPSANARFEPTTTSPECDIRTNSAVGRTRKPDKSVLTSITKKNVNNMFW